MLDTAVVDEPRAAFPSRSPVDQLQSKKRAIVTLRWLLVIAAGYVMLFSGQVGSSLAVDAIVVAMMACNVVIGRLPEHVVSQPWFDIVLLLVDTALLSVGFYLTQAVSSDFYLLYFFVIFLAGVSEKLTAVLMGSVLASVAYLSVTWAEIGAHRSALFQGNVLLRLFFIFAVAMFYGFLVERLRLDRERRQQQYVAKLEGVNARLRELVELKQAFLGSVSHELRTPLNAMLGYIDLVRDGSAGVVKGRVRTYLDRAYQQARHLLRLIEELLSFENLSRGRVEVRLVETDPTEIIERVRETCEGAAELKGLTMHVDIAPDIGPVLTDGNKLLQVLLHLVANAVKFTEQGEVRLTATWHPGVLSSGWEGPVLECQVRDTGPGIPADQQEAIFEDFRQLDGSSTRRHGGMGLGLSVCRGLIQLLRGEICVESTPGNGATFTVRIPAEPPAAQGATPQKTGTRSLVVLR